MARHESLNVTNLYVEKILQTAGTAAGAGLSPDIWGDCPTLQLLSDPTLGVFVIDDFTVLQADGFPYAIYSDTTDTFTALAGQVGGVGRFALSEIGRAHV